MRTYRSLIPALISQQDVGDISGRGADFASPSTSGNNSDLLRMGPGATLDTSTRRTKGLPLVRGRRRKSRTGKHDQASPPGREKVSNGGVGKRLLNAKEAAKYLGLSVDTVYKKARVRELPSVKVGRALRFDVEALDLYIEQHAIKTIE